jgi:hypothetical protein
VPHSWLPSGSTASFRHALIIDGQVAGTWRVQRQPRRNLIHVVPLRRLTGSERRAVGDAADRYAQFVATPTALTIG